ncbi:MAG: hypothetical protein FJX75_26360 [Armatimonadetes bacterium]|nr:hypothetical protein [Armatimonadota bacterium]
MRRVIEPLASPAVLRKLQPAVRSPSTRSLRLVASYGDAERFPTRAKDVLASYHESWERTGGGRSERWALTEAYLHIYTVHPETGEQQAYLFVHCEPCAPDEQPFKLGPHLHIKAAPDPLPRAHLCLFPGRNATILQDLQTLNSALADTAQMLEEEVLERLR